MPETLTEISADSLEIYLKNKYTWGDFVKGNFLLYKGGLKLFQYASTC